MSEQLVRVLCVDDCPDSRAQVVAALSVADAPFEVVEAADISGATRHLDGEPADLVITDVELSRGDGVEVLNLVRASWPDVPVLFIADPDSEFSAVDALRHGADDYVLKGAGFAEHLPLRATAALRRAAIQRGRDRLAAIVEESSDFIGWASPDGTIEYVNRGAAQMIGLPADAIRGHHVSWLRPDDAARAVADSARERSKADGRWIGETEYRTADGTRIPVRQSMFAHRDRTGRITHLSTIAHDLRTIREAERWRQVVLDALPARIALLDVDGVILEANGRWMEYACRWGYAGGGRGLSYVAAVDAAASRGDADAAAVAARLRALLAGDIEAFVHEYACVEPERPDAWYEMRATRADAEHGGAVVAHFDKTEQRRAEAEVNLAASAFAHTAEGIVVLDDAFRVIKVNNAFCEITGHPAGRALGAPLAIFAAELNAPELARDMAAELARNGSWDGELWGRRANGETFPMLIGLNRLAGNGGGARYVGVISDISQHHEFERRLDHLVHHDALTGLPNRFQLQQRLDDAMVRARRSGEQVGLLFLDLNAFKTVNDSLGMAVGDGLLKSVASRLAASLRDGDLLARLGGDEFAVMVEGMRVPAVAGIVAEKLLEAMEAPVSLHGHELVLNACVGIACFPDDAMDSDTLLRSADTALHQAKSSGPGSIQFFAAEMNARALETLVLQASLRTAIEQGQLVLHYQPVVDLPSGRVLGVEALVRWRHPDLGMVPPDRFIPIAEETGLIVRLGEWVLREALHQASVWRTAGTLDGHIAVNLSMRQFRDPNLAQIIADALTASGCPPGALRLELTESTLSADPAIARAVLDRLHALGVQVAVDDFGTGYSSLSYLKAFPLDVLKIDRSFVKDIPGDGDDVAIVRATIGLAHSLGLAVVGEGVETVAQRDLLADAGCDAAQGYLFSRPLAADACSRFLADASPVLAQA